MNIPINFPFKIHRIRRDLLSKSLMFILFFSLLFSCILTVNAANPLIGTIHVGSEIELKNAINSATEYTVIVIDRDITLTETLGIPADKNITLTSNNTGFFKLFGASNQSTIMVETGGMLCLDGIIVTHVSGDSGGCGVIVNSDGLLILYDGAISNNGHIINGVGGVINNGTFIMYGGEISNNNVMSSCGGVVNNGAFTMFGGKIFHNSATRGYGGVVNSGVFILSGGVISGNFGYVAGGVFNDGSFSMSGGEISGNSGAAHSGGGVFNSGSFSMSGGEIFNNTAQSPGRHGGGVFNSGSFSMSGGVISGNTASKGGGVSTTAGSFSMSGGEISNNLASWFGSISGSEPSDFGIGYGGGVYVEGSVFSMSDGVISGNQAVWCGDVLSGYGGGVYIAGDGVFELCGGKISDNTALVNGGGVGVVDVAGLAKVFVADGVIFSNNSASVAYNRDSSHDTIYYSNIGSRVTWTYPFTQGYNNYDISYTNGSLINSPEPSISKTNTAPLLFGGLGIIIVGVAIVLVVGVVAVILLSLKKGK